jgi:hypothetical protein
MGILIAMMFRIVLEIPDWSPSFRSLYSTAPHAVGIWFKRILFYLALFSSTVLAATLNGQITYGVHAAYLVGVFIIFALWNQTPSERRAFWTGKVYERRLYWTSYLTWAFWSAAMVLLVGYVRLGSSYQTFYLFLGISWLALVVAAGVLGRFGQVVDFFTFGYLSIRTGQLEYRFLYNKKRFQNLHGLMKLNEA